MCSEALLEFEQSLAGLSASNELLLNNLELKADLNRFVSPKPAAGPQTLLAESDILSLFAHYDYTGDNAAVCPACRGALQLLTASCCVDYVTQQRQGPGSALERDYWVLFLRNPYRTFLTLPHYSKMAFHQMGVPFQLRRLVWQKLVLVNQKNCYELPPEASMIFTNFQHSYNHRICSQIKKDLGRTFPNVAFFQQPETVDSLLTILNVYANYDLELGYCQGLLFLVGTLYQQLRSSELTFHCMCKIMECESQLRSIYVPALMLEVLDQWRRQFCAIFSQIDAALYLHLLSFCDMSVFLFQWWLSNNLIHAPNLSVNNRIVECCLVEGWKVGNFKIALGLLLQNRLILMSFGPGDEEVVYQHLLNESKWGNVINNTTAFFGDLLLSWDDTLFVPLSIDKDLAGSTQSEKSSILSKFRKLSIGRRVVSDSASDWDPRLDIRTLSSVFSRRDTTSVYSESSGDSLAAKDIARNDSFSSGILSSSELDEVILENQALKFLLKKAYAALDDDTLKKEIGVMIEVDA